MLLTASKNNKCSSGRKLRPTTCTATKGSFAVVQDGLLDSDVSIPINSKEPAHFANLVYSPGRMQEQPNDPFPLCPPTRLTHPFAAKLPRRVVVVGIYETKLRVHGGGGLNAVESDGHSELCPLCKIQLFLPLRRPEIRNPSWEVPAMSIWVCYVLVPLN